MRTKLQGTTTTSAHKLLILLQFLWQLQALSLLVKPVIRIPSIGSQCKWSSKQHIALPLQHNKRLSAHVVQKSKEGATDRLIVDRFAEGFLSVNGSLATPLESSEVIITIHGKQYNLTAWANYHPGGSAVLRKYIDKDATAAFEKAAHSRIAYEMLENFEVGPASQLFAENISSNFENGLMLNEHGRRLEWLSSGYPSSSNNATTTEGIAVHRSHPLWRTKLFTKEDPNGIHKILGVYVLLHFFYRVIWKSLLSNDPSAGLGSRCGRGAALLPILLVVPHGLLSLSSLIFHTVPRERVAGKPMIWQEFRAHNIIFGLRSVLCTILAWASYYKSHTPAWRRLAVWGSSLAVLISNYLADEATDRLRANSSESTTATMPYWEGCSDATKRKFKKFYAFSQFMATIACLIVGNPAWPLSVLLAIQLASLLMTLVRKNLITARAYHYAYTASLIVPYIMVARHLKYLKYPLTEGLAYFALGTCLFQLRRKGVNKYALWGPLVAARVTCGDSLLSWDVW